MKTKAFNRKYRLLTDGKDNQYPYKVERRVLFIWWRSFRASTEDDAMNEIKRLMAKRYKARKEIIREYTEQDYLADKIKNG